MNEEAGQTDDAQVWEFQSNVEKMQNTFKYVWIATKKVWIDKMFVTNPCPNLVKCIKNNKLNTLSGFKHQGVRRREISSTVGGGLYTTPGGRKSTTL